MRQKQEKRRAQWLPSEFSDEAEATASTTPQLNVQRGIRLRLAHEATAPWREERYPKSVRVPRSPSRAVDNVSSRGGRGVPWTATLQSSTPVPPWLSRGDPISQNVGRHLVNLPQIIELTTICQTPHLAQCEGWFQAGRLAL